MALVTTDRYVIVDRYDKPLTDDLETDGLVVFLNEEDAHDSLVWLIDDSVANAYRGFRIEIYNPELHGE